LKSEIERFGGMDALLAPVDPAKIAELKDGLKSLARNYRSGTASNGKPYNLTDEDIAAVDRLADELAASVASKLVAAELQAKLSLTKISPMFEGAYGAHLLSRATDILTSTGKDFVEGEYTQDDGTTKPVKVPAFMHNHADRVMAAGVLTKGLSDRIDFAVPERVAVSKSLTESLQNPFGASSVYSIEVGRITSSPLRQWVMQNKAILSSLQVP
jgi:hypothetical protein